MPLYDLQCEKCGFKIETITTYSKVEELQCLECGEIGVMKITPSQTGGFNFRHNGFSATSRSTDSPETIHYSKGPL